MYPNRIGQNVIRAVELLERMGEAQVSAGRPAKNERCSGLDTRALRRAVQYGLATRTKSKPYVYRPGHEWRDVLKRAGWTTSQPGRPIASVWDWASPN